MADFPLPGTAADAIAAALLEQTGCCRSGRELPPLPGVEAVMQAVFEIRDLLFPGIHAPAAAEQHRAGHYVGRLQSIRSTLAVEIAKAVLHCRSVDLRLQGTPAPRLSADPESLTDRFLQRLPDVQRVLQSDVESAFQNDPAARTRDEIILCYPGIEAICIYRLAHEMLALGVPYLPRLMTEWAHRRTGIDIHPGARIGGSFFIDHGTGVVIGETCEIGSGVTLYQGVTLGAWSFPRDEDGNLIRGAKRHPTLEDRVTVYSNATILGGTTVIGAGSQIGSSVSLNRSVPPNTIVTIERPSLRFRDAA
ncbi:MAG: Serine acetyltransferase [Planctomycetota bacterium]|jgi:serine O-acetyltransferase